MARKVSSRAFYGEYHGHREVDLAEVLSHLRPSPSNGDQAREVLFLVGDSSLDNKFWFEDQARAVNGYERILSPPTSKQDIAYWLNYCAEERGLGDFLVAVNAAVEESTLGARACSRLLQQDRFVRDNITANDTLIVSVGGNDVALAPAPCTIVNMLWLARCVPTWCLERGFGCPLPCEDCCHGCGTSCVSSVLSCPPGLGYFLHLFSARLEAYLRNITSVCRPKRIVACMIYYLDEERTGGWADTTLAALGYDSNPRHLQTMIRKVFELAVSRIRIPGTEVIPYPLFQVLDGKRTQDYCQRVEPSAIGGKRMANGIMDALQASSSPGGARSSHHSGQGSASSSAAMMR